MSTASPIDLPAPARRALRRRLLGLGLGLALGLVACELLVRARVGVPLVERTPLLRVQANPLRGWEMVPGEPHYTYLERVEINSLGLRGPEVPPAKEPGEVRVLVLGDSLTYGQGVGERDTVPARLEERLRELEPDRRWRVVNAGHRGYSLRQSLGLLAELGERIAPDVVLLLWYWNDLDPVDVERIHARLSESGPVTLDLGAPFEGLAALRWRARQLLRRSALLMYIHELRKVGHGPPGTEYAEQGLARLERELDEFVARCAALPARPLIGIVPDVGSLLSPHWTDALAAGAAERAAARGLPLVPLAPALAPLVERTGRPPILVYDGHYDPAGNRALAEALVEPLRALVR